MLLLKHKQCVITEKQPDQNNILWWNKDIKLLNKNNINRFFFSEMMLIISSNDFFNFNMEHM